MLEHFEDFDLSHCGFLDDLILLGFFELFDSDDLFVLVAFALEYHSVCSLPDHTHDIVFLHF